MVTAKPKGKYTYADYAAKPDNERWELIDGELFRMPSPNSSIPEYQTPTGVATLGCRV